MAKNSKIAWTDHTWNPWQGCRKISEGCKNCYMFRDKKRYRQDASVVIRSKKTTFNKPLTWKDPAKVFVCSWSDFFIEEADMWRRDAYDIMEMTRHLTYLLLTKRPENIYDRWPKFWHVNPPENIWIGVTVEDVEQTQRIEELNTVPACIRFLSVEPLLEDLGVLDLTFIDWVIIGAESGPDRRPCRIEWMLMIVEQCKAAGVPVFVKQVDLNGRLSQQPEEWPEDLKIQEFPV